MAAIFEWLKLLLPFLLELVRLIGGSPKQAAEIVKEKRAARELK